MAAAAFVAKSPQPFNAAVLISAMPGADRIVIQPQRRRDALAAPSPVEKDDGVRSAGDPMLGKPIPGNPDQGLPVLARKEAAANHLSSRILFRHPVKLNSAPQ